MILSLSAQGFAKVNHYASMHIFRCKNGDPIVWHRISRDRKCLADGACMPEMVHMTLSEGNY